MVALTKLVLGSVAALSAAWSGGWFYGKSEIKSQLDAQVAEWAEQGVAVSYTSLDIGGFPFAYRGKVVEPKSQGYIVTADGPARADWQAAWLSFDSSLADFGVVNFALPDIQNARVTPTDGKPPADVVIRSNGLGGRLSQSDGRVQINGGGDEIEIAVTPTADEPYVVTVQKFTAIAAAPAGEPGRVTAYVDLEGATANGAAWNLVDPAQGFPRDRANLRLAVAADMLRNQDDSVRVGAVQVDRVALNVAGVEVDGEGGAVLRNRQPDGALTLRFLGLGGFLNNAAGAGLFPEKQADLYRVMVDSFASKGAREGEQVFEIAFRDGYVYVNGAPTFIPAPVLP